MSAVPTRRWAPRVLLPALLCAWPLLWIPLRHHPTARLAMGELAPLHENLNELRDAVDAHRGHLAAFEGFRVAIDQLTIGLQAMISQPSLGRPVPVLGWLGTVALVVLLALAVANTRTAVLAGLGFLSLGLLGLWRESMDTLAMTLAAVLICVVIGVPLGIAAGRSPRVERLVTPVLDLMQTMPTFGYLAPLTLIFLIGPASAVIVTATYALPPVIRIAAHGIGEVPRSVVEAGTSLGATRWQLLRWIQLPMAARMIVAGINQTTMCALSMVTIAALIDAPGLGQTVMRALMTLDVGVAFTGGLAIVILAVVLDRITTAAGARFDPCENAPVPSTRRIWPRSWRRLGSHPALGPLCAASAVAIVAVYLSYTFLWAAVFPGQRERGLIGGYCVAWVNAASEWAKDNLATGTDAIKNAVTYGALNPMEALIAGSPWYLTAAALVALAWIVGGLRAGVVAAGCLGLLLATGLWHDAMITLTSTIVATGIVVVLGVGFGVWMGRDQRIDAILRPLLDAAQVMPAFVYLVPCLGLFGATRFTAIVAAVVFAAPVSIKLVAEGIRAVAPTAVEAAVCAGATRWQVVTKVQLPMAARSLALAANQGLIYVLSMVVVGGLVGAGALGYLVVAGFSQTRMYGKGLAAGFAIVLLGVLLDRTTQAAARRTAAQR